MMEWGIRSENKSCETRVKWMEIGGEGNGGLGLIIDDVTELTLKVEEYYADGREESP